MRIKREGVLAIMNFNKPITKKFKHIALSVFCLALVPILFVCGCNSEKAQFNWVKARIEQYYYWDLPQDCVYDGSVSNFVKKYLDDYSKFYTAEEYKSVQATSSGNMSGLGISFEYLPDGVYPGGESGIHLVKVVGNSPAYYAGLSAGEFVKSGSYNGKSSTFDSSASFSSFLDNIPSGDAFSLTTDKGVYQTKKSEYDASYCYMATNQNTYYVEYGESMHIRESHNGIDCLPNGVAYLRLDQFYGNAATEMAALIEKFNNNGYTSLILDLRRNGGGYVSVMSDISAIYTGQLPDKYPTMGYAEYKNGSKEHFNSDITLSYNQYFTPGVKLSVLADNGTASASEALIGVLISNGVIDYSDVYISDFNQSYLSYSGTANKNCKTYGKGIMQSTYRNTIYGYAIKLTTAKIFWPDGVTSIHGRGLSQDMGCKTVNAEWNVTYEDEQLALAVSQIYG